MEYSIKVDIYKQIASEFFKIPYEEVTKEQRNEVKQKFSGVFYVKNTIPKSLEENVEDIKQVLTKFYEKNIITVHSEEDKKLTQSFQDIDKYIKNQKCVCVEPKEQPKPAHSYIITMETKEGEKYTRLLVNTLDKEEFICKVLQEHIGDIILYFEQLA